MIETELVAVNCPICNESSRYDSSGIHMRPAMQLVDFIAKYDCEIKVYSTWYDYWLDAKSIMQLGMIGGTVGSVFKVMCQGKEEKEAINAFADCLVNVVAKDSLCPDYLAFREEYTVKEGYESSDYRKISTLEILYAYANEIKKGRDICLNRRIYMQKI